MRLSLKTLLPAAALAVGVMATGAEAAPAGSGLSPLGKVPEASTMAEKTYWVRRCYRTRHGVRCHRHWVSPRRHYWRRWH